MIDPTQGILILVVVVLTVIIVVLGIQVYFILREFRKTIHKANKVLDDTGNITESVSGPISSLSSLAGGLRAGVSIAKLFKNKKKLLKRLTEDE